MLGKRRLGQRGLEVTEIGLGCMGMSMASVSLDDAQMRTLDEALAPDKISGSRYDEGTASMVDR